MSQASPVVAADTEVRDFNIYIDSKERGQYRLTINRRDDGTVSVSGEANVRITKVLITLYRYTYNGTEVWKDGRLLGMNSTSDDNGKTFKVSVTPDPKGLRVRVNDEQRLIRGDVWTTTYWKLPDARFHNQPLPLLDADTGKEINGRLDYVGTETVTVGRQAQQWTHFRVTGGPYPVDLWYDAQQRLVRQQFTEDGHRTSIQLIKVGR
jgi:hypothetical protein